MKKFIGLFVIIFSIVLMTSSCEKDPDSTDGGIKIADFNGTWEFQSITDLQGIVWTECPGPLNAIYGGYHRDMLISIIFNNGKCTVIDKCGVTSGPYPASYVSTSEIPYIIVKEDVEISPMSYTFYITDFSKPYLYIDLVPNYGGSPWHLIVKLK